MSATTEGPIQGPIEGDADASSVKASPPTEEATDPTKPATDIVLAPDDGIDEPPSVALRTTTFAIAGTAVVLTIISAFVFDMRATAGVGVGGLLATVNFILFIRLVGAFMSQKGASAPWAVLAGVKLLGLCAFVYVVLKRGDLPPLALALGYGSLPIGISLGSLKPRGAPKPSS